MPLSPIRILTASLFRRAARLADDGLDRAVGMTVFDVAGRFSGRISGCDCTNDSAEGCTRDGEDRGCGCGCHTVIETVLP